MTLFEILYDQLQKRRTKYMLLSSTGWPMTIAENRFTIHTPYLTKAKDYTGDFYESATGWLSHGQTRLKVNQPKISQALHFWLKNERRSVSPNQQHIKRLYNINALQNIDPVYLAHFLPPKRSVADMYLLPNIVEADDSKNICLALIAYHCLRQNSWTISDASFDKTLEQVLGTHTFPSAYKSLVLSGILGYNGDLTTTLRLPGIILLMEALHHYSLKSTKFDRDGVLQFAK